MNKKIVFLGSFLACLLLSVIGYIEKDDSPSDEVVVFVDPMIEAMVRARVEYVTGTVNEDIYASDLGPVDLISISSGGITDLSGLEHCTNLDTVDFPCNLITDISPLSNLDKLESLMLAINNISDIEPLSHLDHLTNLYLEDNLITEISPLADLTELTVLAITSNQIEDISPLTDLINLDELYLGNNLITDILPLVDNRGLDSGDMIVLRGNPLNSQSVESYIPQLQERGVEILWE